MTPLDDALARLAACRNALTSAGDPRRHAAAAVEGWTAAVASGLAAGAFHDPRWVAGWYAARVRRCLQALEGTEPADRLPAPWQAALASGDRRGLLPRGHVLLGLTAHLDYDVPLSLLETIPDPLFADPALLARRAADHERGDRLAPLLLRPVPRPAQQRLLRGARGAVWSNTLVMAAARHRGQDAYAEQVDHLARLAAERVATLAASRGPLTRALLGGIGVSILPAATSGGYPV